MRPFPEADGEVIKLYSKKKKDPPKTVRYPTRIPHTQRFYLSRPDRQLSPGEIRSLTAGAGRKTAQLCYLLNFANFAHYLY